MYRLSKFIKQMTALTTDLRNKGSELVGFLAEEQGSKSPYKERRPKLLAIAHWCLERLETFARHLLSSKGHTESKYEES